MEVRAVRPQETVERNRDRRIRMRFVRRFGLDFILPGNFGEGLAVPYLRTVDEGQRRDGIGQREAAVPRRSRPGAPAATPVVVLLEERVEQVGARRAPPRVRDGTRVRNRKSSVWRLGEQRLAERRMGDFGQLRRLVLCRLSLASNPGRELWQALRRVRNIVARTIAGPVKDLGATGTRVIASSSAHHPGWAGHGKHLVCTPEIDHVV